MSNHIKNISTHIKSWQDQPTLRQRTKNFHQNDGPPVIPWSFLCHWKSSHPPQGEPIEEWNLREEGHRGLWQKQLPCCSWLRVGGYMMMVWHFICRHIYICIHYIYHIYIYNILKLWLSWYYVYIYIYIYFIIYPCLVYNVCSTVWWDYIMTHTMCPCSSRATWQKLCQSMTGKTNITGPRALATTANAKSWIPLQGVSWVNHSQPSNLQTI